METLGYRKLSALCYEQFREPAVRFIREWGKSGPVLVVASTRVAADEWPRAACESALVGIHRYTPVHLAAALAAREIAISGAVPVTHLLVTALAARITNQALTDGSLHYFEPVARMPGFAAALANTLSELRLDRVSRRRTWRGPEVPRPTWQCCCAGIVGNCASATSWIWRISLPRRSA
jgi:hypothetical protein